MGRMDPLLLPDSSWRRNTWRSVHRWWNVGNYNARINCRWKSAPRKIPTQLQHIREASPIRQLIQKQPEIEKWTTRPYSLREIQTAILHLNNNKETGTDGTPGEIYKVTPRHLIAFLMNLMNNIMHGQAIPDQWAVVAIVHTPKRNQTWTQHL